MKVLFLTTEDYSFWSHRLALARAVKRAGAEVAIMTPLGGYRERLEREGFRVIPWSISRRSLNPIREVRSLAQVLWAYRRERPDLVHHVALKPAVYGGIASRLCGSIPSVSNITGLGPVFINSGPLMLFLRRMLAGLLRFALGSPACRVVLQNEADCLFLIGKGIAAREKTIVVPGFGVDTERFVPVPESRGAPVVMLPARMLWEKGVVEFVKAAKEVRKRGVEARMVLVGAPDRKNPGCIPEELLEEWADEGTVEWWGQREDMPSVLSQAHVVCLPSYREGFPKVLLEAAACGRPIVTTTAPGCADAVRHGETGLLVPPRDAQSLAAAILNLVQDEGLRQRMGAAGRARAVYEFSDQLISRRMLDVYREVLDGAWHPVEAPEENVSVEAVARPLRAAFRG